MQFNLEKKKNDLNNAIHSYLSIKYENKNIRCIH